VCLPCCSSFWLVWPPLTVAAGVIPTAYATTGLTGIPAAFVVIAFILAIFAAGYVTMARHIRNAGAAYAFISHGLGRTLGVPAALVALLAYSMLQIGLYGALGPAAATEAATYLHVHAQWWVWALGAWAIITILGVLRVDITGRVLGVLLCAELLVIIAETALGLAHPAGGHLSFATLSPSALTSAGFGTFGVLAVIAVLGFVGFEQAPVLGEEARNTHRTIPVATYTALGVIAVIYAAASWAMAAHSGTSGVVSAAGKQGPGLLFGLGGSSGLGEVAQVLFMTSLFAAALSFHNSTWRYAFVLGRENVLPAGLGRTGANNIPKAASLAQSFTAVVVIGIYAVTGQDPMARDVLLAWHYGRVRGTPAADRHRRGDRGVLRPRPARGERLATADRPRPVRDPARRDRCAGHPQLRHPPRRPIGERRGVDSARLLSGSRGHRRPVGRDPAQPPPRHLPDDRARPARHHQPAHSHRPQDAGMNTGPREPLPRRRRPRHDIINATEADTDALSQVIADAFHDLPQSQWLISDPAARQDILPGYFRILVEHVLATGTVHTTPDRSAAALWIPISADGPTQPDDYAARLAEVTGPWASRFTAFDAALERNHPASYAHHHLAILAVHPTRQGQGTGSSLLRAYHQVLDQGLNLPAYLEAAQWRTRQLYRRHGYLPSGLFYLPDGGPPFFPMARPAQHRPAPADLPGPDLGTGQSVTVPQQRPAPESTS